MKGILAPSNKITIPDTINFQ